MDPISKFLTDYKIPIGPWGKAFFSFLTDNFDTIFRAFSNGLNFILNGLVDLFLMVPPVLLALIIAIVAWLLQRSRPLAIGVFLGLIFIINQNLWKQTVQTLVLVVAAAAMAMAIGVPLGIWAAHKPKVYRVMLPVLDLMQTLPSFVYLIPTVMIFGPGKIPALIATIVYAAPPLVRLTDLGLRSVDPAVMEASRAFGTNPRQRLFGVQIPLALPTILAGVNQTTMMALSMVVIASMIGAGGLGYQVLQGIGRLEVSRGLFAGLGIVALAIVFDRITQAFGRQLQARIGLQEAR